MSVHKIKQTKKLDNILTEIVYEYEQRELKKAFVVDSEHIVITIEKSAYNKDVVNILITSDDNRDRQVNGDRLSTNGSMRSIINKCPITERHNSYVYFGINFPAQAKELTNSFHVQSLKKGKTVTTRNNKEKGFKQVMT